MKNTHRLTALFLALICCLPMAVACGKKGGISVNKEQAMEELQKSDAKTQESKNAEAESKKQASAEKLAQAQSAKETETETQPVETKGPVEEVALDKTLYQAPPKTAEVYDPDNPNNRELKVFGASNSDGDYNVLYGECAVGATVTVTTDFGTSSVVSEGGCFALRFLNEDMTAIVDVTQSYNGEQIGESLHWEGEILLPEYGDDWGVWIGGENQGFYHKMIPDFEHTNLMDDATIQSVTERYADRVEKLKTVGDGCEIIAVLVPASMTVYPELVPEEVATPGEGESRFDQLAAALTEAGVKVIDCRDAFEERKNDSLPLYFNYDSHWNDYGSYIAYVELYDYISDRYPDAAPRTFDEFNWDWAYYTRGDIPYYFDICYGGTVFEYTFQRSFNFDAVPAVRAITRYPDKGYSLAYNLFGNEIRDGKSYNTHREELPDVMVYRNSYGGYMYDLILERSNKAFMMPTFSYTFNLAQIKKNEPDYLIYIMSEWDFGNIINN